MLNRAPLAAIDELPDNLTIIGAGLAGLMAARELRKAGYPGKIDIYEKGQTPGGRLRSKIMQGDILPVVDLGAGRMHDGDHKLLCALCDELGLKRIPFNYAVKYREPNNRAASPADLSRNFSSLQTVAQNFASQKLSFAKFCERVVGPDAFEQLRLQSGYDFFDYKTLPMDAGIAVYKHLPETQSLLNGAMHNWYYLAKGFQSITNALQEQLENVKIHYGSELISIHPSGRTGDEYLLKFTGRGGKRAITAGAVIFATPLQNIEEVQGWSDIAPDSLPEGVQTVPLLKGYMRFTPASACQAWWGKDVGEKDTCIVADLPLRRVYFTKNSSIVWWYCDSERAPKTLAFLTSNPHCHLELMQKHLNRIAPNNIRIIDKGHMFWANGNSYSPHADCPIFNNAGFLNPRPNLFVISDALADSGWMEGSLRSVKAFIDNLQAVPSRRPVPAMWGARKAGARAQSHLHY